MNEISILMHMLSNKSNLYQIGATKREILHTLNVKNKNKSGYFQQLIINLSKYIEPLGLQIRYNPITLIGLHLTIQRFQILFQQILLTTNQDWLRRYSVL